MDIIFFDHPRFADDLFAVLENSKDGKVKALISSSSIENIGKQLAICDKYDQFMLYTTCGIHPHNTKNINIDESIKEVEKIVTKENKVVAIGETGIDLERKFYPLEQQKNSFTAHIKLAFSVNKPLIFMAKQSHTEVINVLKLFDSEELLKIPKIITCFDGMVTEDEIQYYNSIGCYYCICGLINDDCRNKPIITALKHITLDKILTITYAPFYSPVPNYKSEPQYMQHITQKIENELNIKKNTEFFFSQFKTLQELIESNWITIFPSIKLLSDEQMKVKILNAPQTQNKITHPKTSEPNKETAVYRPAFLNKNDNKKTQQPTRLDLNDESQFPSLSSTKK